MSSTNWKRSGRIPSGAAWIAYSEDNGAMAFKCDKPLPIGSRGTFYREHGKTNPGSWIDSILAIPGVVVVSANHDPYALFVMRSSELFPFDDILDPILSFLEDLWETGSTDVLAHPVEPAAVESNATDEDSKACQSGSEVTETSLDAEVGTCASGQISTPQQLSVASEEVSPTSVEDDIGRKQDPVKPKSVRNNKTRSKGRR
jgi:hypothetical protein